MTAALFPDAKAGFTDLSPPCAAGDAPGSTDVPAGGTAAVQVGTTRCLQRVLPFSNPLVIQKTQTQLSIQPEGAVLMSQDYRVVMEARGEH